MYSPSVDDLHLLAAAVWGIAILFAFTAYKHRKVWKVGYATWIFSSIGFANFGLREMLQAWGAPSLGAFVYLFGMSSASFLLASFLYVYMQLYQRKKPGRGIAGSAIAFNIVILAVFAYLSYSSSASETIKMMGVLEDLAWLVQGAATVYIMYSLGTVSTGGFVRVYLSAQIAAYLAFVWKLLALVSPESRVSGAFFELLFAVFSTIGIYRLAKMLKRLSKHMEGS